MTLIKRRDLKSRFYLNLQSCSQFEHFKFSFDMSVKRSGNNAYVISHCISAKNPRTNSDRVLNSKIKINGPNFKK